MVDRQEDYADRRAVVTQKVVALVSKEEALDNHLTMTAAVLVPVLS